MALKGFTEEEVIPFAELARRKPYQVRFIEFMPLDADGEWAPDKVLPGDELRAMIDRVYPLGRCRASPTPRLAPGASATARARWDSSTRCPSPSAAIATGSG